MRQLPMRRSKLVGTEGPGSLVISPEGETAVVGALDLWFRDYKGIRSKSIEEFEVHEPRLKAILKVDKFYKPPEFRKSGIDSIDSIPNSNLVIPLMRFPRWHFCSSCMSLKKLELDQTSVYLDCSICMTKKYFKQVPFVVICEQGHLSDFPWNKWVHKNQNSECRGNLRIRMIGGTTLESWRVECDECGINRKLKGITSSNEETKTSFLGDNLNKKSLEKYTCEGERPWCGDERDECFAAPVAVLRNSISVYMSKNVSSLAIPGDYNENIDLVISKIQSPNKNLLRTMLLSYNSKQIKEKINCVRQHLRFDINQNILDQEIEDALMYLESGDDYKFTEEEMENPERLIKQKEFEKLISRVNSQELKVEPEWIYEKDKNYENHYYKSYLERISRVVRLKETTALYGFDRKNYNIDTEFSKYYPLLYKNYDDCKERWLPVSEVYGEGIFLQLNVEKVDQWENSVPVKEYFQKYLDRVNHIEKQNLIELNPRNIMLHTLSHFLIDEFANKCGYNRSSIKERLYLENNQIGVLLYISDGDSEGTLGGLVRLGIEDKFFSILDKAKNNAEWCSSDPVCTEIGQTQGQGVNRLNGSSCYNCSYIPETSCEIWNLYLDRSLLIDEKIGYFKF